MRHRPPRLSPFQPGRSVLERPGAVCGVVTLAAFAVAAELVLGDLDVAADRVRLYQNAGRGLPGEDRPLDQHVARARDRQGDVATGKLDAVDDHPVAVRDGTAGTEAAFARLRAAQGEHAAGPDPDLHGSATARSQDQVGTAAVAHR